MRIVFRFAVSCVAVSVHLQAQTITSLLSFKGDVSGGFPYSRLVCTDTMLYGTTINGGERGTVFRVGIDGAGLATLHAFSALDTGTLANQDGADPYAGLVLSGNTLYGTTAAGGRWGAGTVFAINTDGTEFRTLYSFAGGEDGNQPMGDLLLLGSVLYGTTYKGGGQDAGTVFAINTNGTSYTRLHTFDGADGLYPAAALVGSGSSLYGTTHLMNSRGMLGTVFTINTDGSGFRTLYGFSRPTGLTNSDGGDPYDLTLVGDTLYGTTENWGPGSWGTVFKLKTDGTSFEVLHAFSNHDGASPHAGVLLCGDTLYGTARVGGSAGYGTVFSVKTDGTGFRILHGFVGATTDGDNPFGGLVSAGGFLYGTTAFGGNNNHGCLFSISLPTQPRLTIYASSGNVLLKWPTNTSSYMLQTSTNLAATSVWAAVSFPSNVVNGYVVVTNPTASTSQFFRVSQ